MVELSEQQVEGLRQKDRETREVTYNLTQRLTTLEGEVVGLKSQLARLLARPDVALDLDIG